MENECHKCIRLLLSNGAEINIVSFVWNIDDSLCLILNYNNWISYGRTLLHLAAYDSKQCMELLLSHDARIIL